ncbi:class II aldolase/adducin family protein [soil metagenome]
MTPSGEGRGLRTDIVEAVNVLFRADVMSHSGHANFSARLDGDRMLVTTGVIVRDLSAEDMVVIGFDGKAPDGPSSTCAEGVVAMHVAAYRARPDARAVVHTHSPCVTAFAVDNRPLPCRYETLLRFGGQAGEVPVAPWTPGRSDEAFLRGIADAFDRQPGTKAVLLANHGVLALALSPMEAALLVIALEEAAAAELAAAEIGGAVDLPIP